MKKKIIPLKYKLLVLLIIIPLSGLLAFALYSTKKFEDDKIAYVFSSSLNTVRSLSNQLQSHLVQISKFESLLVSSFNQDSQRFLSLYEGLKKNSEDILYFQLYSFNKTGSFSKLTNTSLPEGEEFQILENKRVESFESLAADAANQRLIHYTQGAFPKIAIFTKFNDDQGKAFYFAVTYLNGEDTNSLVNQQSEALNYLIDQKGVVLIGQQQIDGQNVTEFKNWGFLERILSNGLQSGTFETLAPNNSGQNYLASYSKLGNGQIFLSLISKAKALAAIEYLKKKFYIFVLAIIGAAGFIAILSSRQLTSALEELYHMAIKLGQGDLDARLIVKSNDEIGLLSQTFNGMASKINELLTEIRNYAGRLEIMVEERTSDLNKALGLQKAMVDSLDQGFFIFDRAGTILDVYSKAAERIFETIPTNMKLPEILKLPDHEHLEMEEFCQKLIDEELPFNDMAMLAPEKMENSAGRKIFFDYAPVRNEEGHITGVVLIATDKTEEIKAQEEAEKERAHAKMIITLVNNKTQFVAYIQSTYIDLKNINMALQKGEAKFVDELFRVIHTVKGNSGLFHLKFMNDICHDFENHLSEVRNGRASEDRQFCISQIDHIIESLNQFVRENKTILGINDLEHIEPSFEILEKNLEEFHDLLIRANGPEIVTQKFYNNIYSQGVSHLLQHYKELVENTSVALGKKVEPLKIQDNGIRVVYGRFSSLFNSLAHALRNAVDHGIETPGARLGKGKSPVGTIVVNFSEKTISGRDYINIVIQDDGGGIDPEKIKAKMIENGHADLIKGKSAQEVIQFIFDAGFSMAGEVTHYSGRGVGMDAIKDAAKAMGGDVLVNSELDKGTQVVVTVPKA